MQSITIPVKYIDTTKYKVTIWQDDWAENPTEWGTFEIVTFSNNRWTTDVDPEQYQTESGKLLPSLQAKLKAGTAFWLDIYEHSSVHYSLSGEGMQDRWDTASRAGIIFLTDAKNMSYEQRQQFARDMLKTYTDWANGEVYTVRIETESGREVDQLSGLYGTEGIKDFITETIGDAEYTAKGKHLSYSTGGGEYEVSL